MTTTTSPKMIRFYQVRNLSAQQRMNIPTTCQHCGREGLKRTVRMIGDNGLALWMGTGCANRAMWPGFTEEELAARPATEA